MKYTTPLSLLALLLFLLAACGSTHPALTGPHGAKVAQDSPRLVGVWLDTESTTRFHVELVDGVAKVTSIIDGDGEVFDIREEGFVDGNFHWTYHVPSTGYVTSFTVTAITDATLVTQWSGTGGGGTEVLERVR